jgi:small-conductance mechanosensitive channel
MGFFTILALFQAGLLGNAVLAVALAQGKVPGEEKDPPAATTLSVLRFIGRLVIWSIVVLLALDNLGVNVTGLLAGLGVGGIAVALALQNILGDLFASLSVTLDKPFVVGDFIVVGEFMGTIEYVGWKTTRVRSLSGEQLVFANTDLLTSRIRNFKRMSERRVVFTLGVLYGTPTELVERIPAMLEEAVTKEPATRFERAHFKGFGDSALLFECVYHVLAPEYAVYMDTQQSINLTLLRRFRETGIEFAFPTRTVYLEGGALLQQSAAPGERGRPG